jgi:hypothetical protein
MAHAGRAVPPVLHLFEMGSPTAVVGLVVPVVVDTFQRMLAGRSPSHICQELIEGVAPLVTHTDPTPAVVPEVWMAGLMATPHHCVPRPVLRAVACAATGRPQKHRFADSAAATAGTTKCQCRPLPDDFFPAVTSANPQGTALAAVVVKNNQPTEALAGHVYPRVWHRALHSRGVWPRNVSALPGPFHVTGAN